MKKILALIMTVCMLLPMACIANASGNDDNVFYYGNKEIVVEGQELSREEMKKIADFIAGEDDPDGISTHGITCTLLGHKLTESTVTETEHNVYSTAPKCVLNKYIVKTCSRCDYIEKELINSQRIYCH